MKVPNNNPSVHNSDLAAVWKPSTDQINELQALLPEFISKQPLVVRLVSSPQKYGMQFVGVSRKARKGSREIYVNAFCNSWGQSPAQLREQPVMVLDGGGCYFQMTYDPVYKSFSEFSVNEEG